MCAGVRAYTWRKPILSHATRLICGGHDSSHTVPVSLEEQFPHTPPHFIIILRAHGDCNDAKRSKRWQVYMTLFVQFRERCSLNNTHSYTGFSPCNSISLVSFGKVAAHLDHLRTPKPAVKLCPHKYLASQAGHRPADSRSPASSESVRSLPWPPSRAETCSAQQCPRCSPWPYECAPRRPSSSSD